MALRWAGEGSASRTLACDQEFARAGAPQRVAVEGTNNVGPTINALGTDEQKSHLSAILHGDEFWCRDSPNCTPEATSPVCALEPRSPTTNS